MSKNWGAVRRSQRTSTECESRPALTLASVNRPRDARATTSYRLNIQIGEHIPAWSFEFLPAIALSERQYALPPLSLLTRFGESYSRPRCLVTHLRPRAPPPPSPEESAWLPHAYINLLELVMFFPYTIYPCFLTTAFHNKTEFSEMSGMRCLVNKTYRLSRTKYL
jgi:hypothetical protein